MQVVRELFYQTISTWQRVPFCQMAGWVDAQATNQRELLYLLDEDVAAVGHLKHFAGFSYLMLQAPALRCENVKVSKISAFYSEVRNLADMVEVNDQSVYGADMEVALRQAGYLRPVGSFSYQLTSMIDLTQPLHLDRNWSRKVDQIKGLRLEVIEHATEQDIQDYMFLYTKMCTNKNMAVPHTTEYIQTLLSDPHFRLFFETTDEGERVAMLLIHMVGTHAGGLYAATSEEGKERLAGFAIYMDVLPYLASQGFRSFDHEKMGASTHSTNAVFQFKQGMGGKLTPLVGEWQWCRKSWMAVGLYWIKKYIWKRTQA